MNSIHNFLTVSAVIILFASVRAEAKPTSVISLDGGNFGPIENKGNEMDEVEISSYGGGGGGSGGVMDPTALMQPWGNGARQDLLQMNQFVKVILDEIRNRRLQRQAETEVGRSQALPPRSTFGKRQIVYRQCFFNPISCF